MALDDLGNRGGQLGDLGELARSRPDPNPGRHREADRGRIDLEPVATDHPALLEPLYALGDRRRGHPDPAAELRHADSGIGLQGAQDANVYRIERDLRILKALTGSCNTIHGHYPDLPSTRP